MISDVARDREMGRQDFRSFVGSPEISEEDIHQTANMLIEQHGAEAAVAAERVLYQMLDRGDRGGLLVWMRVKWAIANVQAPRRRPAH